MRTKLIVIVTAVALVATASPAAAQYSEGYIVEAFRERNQPHRVYVVVGSGNKDSEHCRIKLAKKITTLNTDTDNHQSGLSYLYYTHVRFAKIAMKQAKRQMPGPTWRVQCETES